MINMEDDFKTRVQVGDQTFNINNAWASKLVELLTSLEKFADVQLPVMVTPVLVNVGPKFISVIKEVRAVKCIGLKEAKDLVDAVRYQSRPLVLGTYTLESARKIQEVFAEAGAQVDLPSPLSILADNA